MKCSILLAVLSWVLSFNSWAAEFYFTLPIAQLDLEEPTNAPIPPARGWLTFNRLAYVTLDGGGEAYIDGPAGWFNRGDKRGDIVGCLPVEGPISGTLVLRDADRTLFQSHFKAKASPQGSTSKTNFCAAKARYFQELLDQSIPGGGWFAFQVERANKMGNITNAAAEQTRFNRPITYETERDYDLFSGRRAVNENLQLDRQLRFRTNGDPVVDISSLKGITVAAIDWKPLVTGLQPELDALANFIPEDQHAIFFPSFESLLQVMDHVTAYGDIAFGLGAGRGEDSQLSSRYQTQLCLSTSEIARQMGPMLVKSVAITGGDVYLDLGSDISLLFECKQPAVLLAYIRAKQMEAKQKDPQCQTAEGEINGISYMGVVNARRTVCSYVARSGDVVCVSNSKKGIESLANAAAGKVPVMAKANEYVFFRNRYPRAEETALAVLTDATIRRWCGPVSRIGCARRARAATRMYAEQAESMLTHGTTNEATSPIFGNLDFMTPVSELEIAKVTQAEADGYTTWRNQYQSYWRGMFDPIAIQLCITNQELRLGTTVMPLIVGSSYASFLETTRDAHMNPKAGYLHKEALFQLGLAINPKSSPLSFVRQMAQGNRPAAGNNPLGWMGETVSVFLDEDPLWTELIGVTNVAQAVEDNVHRLPVGASIEVANPLATAAFLTTLRVLGDDTAPNMLNWESQEYGGMKYMRIQSSDPTVGGGNWGKMKLYYLVTSKQLLVSLNEDIIKRAIDKKNENYTGSSWLGTSAGLQVTDKGISILRALLREEASAKVQGISWDNLPILNEWHRLFPQEDPVAVHYRYSHTRLVCPAGGKYVWNPKWGTMESTACGHPGEPKVPDKLNWDRLSAGNFGLSLEGNQLRAKMVLLKN